jgi:hypothetical protein
MDLKIIKIGEGIPEIMQFPNAIVDYTPQLKYKVEKKNAIDPSIIIKRKPYRQDDFICSVPCSTETQSVTRLIDFLSNDAVFYIETTVDNTTIQRKISNIDLPIIKNDARKYPDLIKFSLSSIYKEENYIDFSHLYSYGNNYGACYGF